MGERPDQPNRCQPGEEQKQFQKSWTYLKGTAQIITGWRHQYENSERAERLSLRCAVAHNRNHGHFRSADAGINGTQVNETQCRKRMTRMRTNCAYADLSPTGERVESDASSIHGRCARRLRRRNLTHCLARLHFRFSGYSRRYGSEGQFVMQRRCAIQEFESDRRRHRYLRHDDCLVEKIFLCRANNGTRRTARPCPTAVAHGDGHARPHPALKARFRAASPADMFWATIVIPNGRSASATDSNIRDVESPTTRISRRLRFASISTSGISASVPLSMPTRNSKYRRSNSTWTNFGTTELDEFWKSESDCRRFLRKGATRGQI